MKYLIIGSGGREHAIGWKLANESKTKKVYFAPGNGGTVQVGENVELDVTDFNKLIEFATQKEIDVTVVGPEVPLVDGIVDEFEKRNLKIFGPNKYASQLEGSKAFSKDFMEKYNIPTASYKTFTDFKDAKNYIESGEDRCVVKASGLAAGKGAIVCMSKSEAIDAVDEMLNKNVFGESGKEVVIEEFMDGEEASIFVITDGNDYRILPPAQDHKRVGEGDTGLNTGGMGAYTPAPIVTDEVLNQVKKEIIERVLDGMKQEGTLYKGLLYVGVMIKDNYAKVVEFNCRFGDPETQPVLYAMKEDLSDYILASIEGNIANTKEIDFNVAPTVGVVVASEGYPGKYEKGFEIGLFDEEKEGCVVFHAGTTLSQGKLISSGGRVLSVVASEETFAKAINKVNSSVEKIELENKYYRRDIGYRVLTNAK